MNHEDNPCPIDGWRRRVIDRDETSVYWECPYCHGISRETWEGN